MVICQSYGINTIIISSIALPKKKRNIPFFFIPFLISIYKATKCLRFNKVDIVLAMGSFTSIPMGIASKILRKKLYLHEGNVIVGKANRFLSCLAKVIFISFPLKFPKSIFCRQALLGMPLRPELIKHNDNFINMGNKIKTILIFGGSQGANKINKAFKSFVSSSQFLYKVIHLTGLENNQELQSFYEKQNIDARIFSYYEDMASLYQKVDLVICRSGASSIAELAYFGKSCILIPLANSADNHQKFNAEYVYSFKSCYIIEENELDRLRIIIEELLENNSFLMNLSTNIHSLKMENCAEKIIDKIHKF